MLDGTLELFAQTAPGLEALTQAELHFLGVGAAHAVPGGVPFSGDFSVLMRAALHLRTASRILMRMARFPAYNLRQLASRSKAIPWEHVLHAKDRVFVKAACQSSAIYHDKAASERVLEAVCIRTGGSPASVAEDATATVFLRIEHDLCTLSVDATGLMHQRGYRQETAKAPLRETWAAAVLLLSGWDGTRPLLDPMCGSGTFPIEAACMAAGIPAGRLRRFPFLQWPSCDGQAWKALLQEADAHVHPIAVPILGADRDAGAVEAARRNAARAGVERFVSFECRPLSATPAMTGPGLLVCNPPWGERVGDRRHLRDLYAALGNVIRSRLPEFRVALLTPHEFLARAAGLFDTAPAVTFPSGGVRVRVYLS